MTTPIDMPGLIHGAGATPAQGACVMQAVAWLASDGKQWTDAPDCTHPVLRRVAVWVNDSIGDVPRRQLWPLVPRLMGTAAADADAADSKIRFLTELLDEYDRITGRGAPETIPVARWEALRDEILGVS